MSVNYLSIQLQVNQAQPSDYELKIHIYKDLFQNTLTEDDHDDIQYPTCMLYHFLCCSSSSIGADWLDPVELFAAFLKHISHDHRVVLDLLISPETRFLSCFLKLLHHIKDNKQRLIVSAVLDADMICADNDVHKDQRQVVIT